MHGIDPGEFRRDGVAREQARADRERATLDRLLGAGWSRDTAAEARRLHEAAGEAVAKWVSGCVSGPCNEAALSLVGEARGEAVAEWWARMRDLDETTRRLLAECAGAAASMAMLDGFLLGRETARAEQLAAARPPLSAREVTAIMRVDGARANGVPAAVGAA